MANVMDDLRPALAFMRKHQFWLVLALVPCVLVPTLFAAQATLEAQKATNRNQIKARQRELDGIKQKAPHPNAQWKTALDTEADRIRRETLDEWRRLWASQSALRAWPQELGQSFISQVAKWPTGVLDFEARTRYQTDVRDFVKQLPERMGAEERMVERRAGAGAETGEKPQRPAKGFRIDWRPESQKTIYGAFDWAALPGDGRAATAQIVQAQEELWVYGLLCDAVKRANGDAKTDFDAAIVAVEDLLVGYPAAEERPGGQGEQRLMRLPGGPEIMGPGVAQPQAYPKPAHPRFGGSGAQPAGGPAFSAAFPGAAPAPAGGPPGASPAADAAYRECIYVDFNGKPLSAAELDAGGSAMVHLMPFRLRMTMDERKIDAFLADLATQPIPIDVRQLRINPGSGEPGGSAPGGRQSEAKKDRKHDVAVEIRGTVGLATPPVETPPGAAPGDPRAVPPAGQ